MPEQSRDAKYVGVADAMLLSDEAGLKRAALMFDSVCLAGTFVLRYLENRIPQDKAGALRSALATSDWLHEKGVLVPAPPEFGSEAVAEGLLDVVFSPDGSRLRQEFLKRLRGPQGERLSEAAVSGITRRAARRLEDETGWETVVFDRQTDRAVPVFSSGKDTVAQVVLKSLPVPDDATPWETILEYRSDLDSRTRFLRLKHWINGVVGQNKGPRELRDEIETLLAEYEDHMKLHGMKVNTSGIETFVVTSAEILAGC